MQSPFCLAVQTLSALPPYDSCPSINSSVVKLMDATEIPRKSPSLRSSLARPLFAPLDSLRGWSSFIVQIRAFYTFRERDQPILIAADRSVAPPSHQSPPPNPWPPTSSPLSSFLTDQTAAPLLYGSLLPDAVLPFSDRKGRERRRRGLWHGNRDG